MPRLRLGTRGSPLALFQAHLVRDEICRAAGVPQGAVEIVVFKTTGDKIQDRPLSEAGGKGLFTKELEEALIENRIDLAVHSMKDVPTVSQPGLGLAAILPREDVRDAFISLKHGSIRDLPQGAKVGTSSLRRQAQLLRLRPDLEVVPFRGNVETRLTKLAEGIADATFLAVAGLKRLGLEARITAPIETTEMLPAVAQGAIGIECRLNDTATHVLVAPLNHNPTAIAVKAERALLGRLDGSCRTPIAGLATLRGDRMLLTAELVAPDGREHVALTDEGATAAPETLGVQLADRLLAKASPELLAAIHHTGQPRGSW